MKYYCKACDTPLEKNSILCSKCRPKYFKSDLKLKDFIIEEWLEQYWRLKLKSPV